MRILLTTPSMQARGAERVVTMLATELVARGHDIALAAPRGTRDEDLRDIPHLRLPLDDHGRAAAGAAYSALRLARAIHHFSPDVVHAQNVKSAVTARAAALVARPRRSPPVLATFHGVLPVEYRRSARLLRTADHVACVSSDLLDNIVAAGLPAQRASLIRNAIPPAIPLDPTCRAELDSELSITGAPVVVIVGRLVAQKAHERFVVAARRVADELPAVRFLIVGEGPRREEIEQEVAGATLESHVRFTGVRSDAREIIARAEIVVFSSEWEGLSIVALEALGAGTPVVSTDVQGMRELLAGGAGAVVPLDDGAALGERVVSLLRNEPERMTMGEAGRKLIARDFPLDNMIDAYERLYERLTRSQ
jgi:glycosyltransferase involved in cell wall biosynthesis